MGEEGFSSDSSLLYHRGIPSAVVDATPWELPDQSLTENRPLLPRHLRAARRCSRARSGSAPTPSPAAASCSATATCGSPTSPRARRSPLYRNAIGDECVYVESGAATVETVFGALRGRARATTCCCPAPPTHRWVPDGDEPLRAYVIEANSHIAPPKRYLSRYGQLLEHAPYCERDLHGPTEPLLVEGTDVEILVKHRGVPAGITGTRYVVPTHPFDVVGWDGCLYPYTFNVADFEPITGRVHQPPPVHQVFEGQNFVICNFVPRKVDYHPLAVPVPYYHSNVDSDEVMFYCGGDYEARKGSGIGQGSISLHPGGHSHGPQPGAVERSLGAEFFDELAVMVDTFRPLELGEGGRRARTRRTRGAGPDGAGVTARPYPSAGGAGDRIGSPTLAVRHRQPALRRVLHPGHDRRGSASASATPSSTWPSRSAPTGPTPRSPRRRSTRSWPRAAPAGSRSASGSRRWWPATCPDAAVHAAPVTSCCTCRSRSPTTSTSTPPSTTPRTSDGCSGRTRRRSLPNWKHLPVGYHGRAGTVVVSGTDIVRPSGQRKDPPTPRRPSGRAPASTSRPSWASSSASARPLGAPIPVDAFADHVFGAVPGQRLVRPRPAGLGVRAAGPAPGQELRHVGLALGGAAGRAGGRPRPPPRPERPAAAALPARSTPWGLDVDLAVEWNGEVVSRPPYREMYWSPAQMLAHMTVNGASARTGDLFASGTISGPAKDQRGAFIELTWGGREPITVNGEQRTFLLDGDEVVLTGTAPGSRAAASASARSAAGTTRRRSRRIRMMGVEQSRPGTGAGPAHAGEIGGVEQEAVHHFQPGSVWSSSCSCPWPRCTPSHEEAIDSAVRATTVRVSCWSGLRTRHGPWTRRRPGRRQTACRTRTSPPSVPAAGVAAEPVRWSSYAWSEYARAGRTRRRPGQRSRISPIAARSSGSLSLTARNAATQSTATSGAVRFRLSVSTLASFHRRADSAIHRLPRLRGPDAPDLVGGDRGSRPGPAHQDPEVRLTAGDLLPTVRENSGQASPASTTSTSATDRRYSTTAVTHSFRSSAPNATLCRTLRDPPQRAPVMAVSGATEARSKPEETS